MKYSKDTKNKKYKKQKHKFNRELTIKRNSHALSNKIKTFTDSPHNRLIITICKYISDYIIQKGGMK